MNRYSTENNNGVTIKMYEIGNIDNGVTIKMHEIGNILIFGLNILEDLLKKKFIQKETFFDKEEKRMQESRKESEERKKRIEEAQQKAMKAEEATKQAQKEKLQAQQENSLANQKAKLIAEVGDAFTEKLYEIDDNLRKVVLKNQASVKEVVVKHLMEHNLPSEKVLSILMQEIVSQKEVILSSSDKSVAINQVIENGIKSLKSDIPSTILESSGIHSVNAEVISETNLHCFNL